MDNTVMKKVPRKPSPNDCRFWTCDWLGAPYLVSVIRLTPTSRTLSRVSVPICNQHVDLMNDAKELNLPIIETPEGWIYIDTIPMTLAGEITGGIREQQAGQERQIRVGRDSECPKRGPGLSHTQDTRIRPSGDCIHCGAPLRYGE